MEYHVSIHGNNQAAGTKEAPFGTISHAATLAQPGDIVTVHAGVYREWVSPSSGGTKEQRIVYQAAGDGEVIITGAEPLNDWKEEKELGDNIWSAEVSNEIFTLRNPFKEELYGDWLFEGSYNVHLGDIFLDGKSLYECDSIEKVQNPQIWPQAKYPEDSLLQWYAQVNEKTTKLWVNLGGKNPCKENVEINVRPYCFWPEKTGCNYITVKGFTLTQASPQWAPPTALQEGLIGPHWSKGWIIEDNIISESKCVGVSLGKEITTGQNEWSNLRIKGGTQREQEVIFRASRMNWNKDEIGGHIVRNNIIHDCEQAGIVGHLGCVFSEISKNRIYNVHHKRLFHGAEVGGIKLHASLDVKINDNVIYGCYRALWLDWQAQGIRISRNAFFDNVSEDFFVEVCHGPYMVDHNLFLSPMNFRNMAQGGAFAHNLFAGRFVVREETSRYTPYHFPHETTVAGYANITGGDDKYYNNIFLRDGDTKNDASPMTFFEHLPLPPRKETTEDGKPVMDGIPDNSRCYLYPVGLGGYNEHPAKGWWTYTKEEMKEMMAAGKKRRFGNEPLPVAMSGNLYLKNAVPSTHESEAKQYSETGLAVEIDKKMGKVQIKVLNPGLIIGASQNQVSTESLGESYHAEMAYESPDGTAYCLDSDFFGTQRPNADVTPGPFELTKDGVLEFKI